MSIRQRLTLGTFFLFALLLLSAGLGIFQLGRLAADTRAILKDNYETARYVQDMQKALLEGDRTAFESTLRKQEGNITEPGEADVTARLRSDIRAWGTDSAAERRIQQALHAILALNLDAMERKNAAALATAQRSRLWLWGIAALVLVLGLAFSLGFPKLITRPIQRLRHAVEEVSGGNYRHRVPSFRSDELGALSEAFNEMAAKLEQWESSNLARVMTEKTRAEAVINSLQDASIGLDEQGNVLFANQEALVLLAMTEADIVGKPGKEAARSSDLLRVLLFGNGQAPLKIVKDGREQFYTMDRVPITRGAEQLGTVVVVRNITPFEEKDRAKTHFLATISHELKTPLASTDIGLSLLERAQAGQLTADQAAIVSDLRKDHQRLVRIVSELLDLAQVETGTIRVTVSDHALERLIEDALAEVKVAAHQKDIRFARQTSPAEVLVHADPDKAVWVLVNVLSNAIRHSPHGGVIALESRIRIGHVELSIADQGPGVPAPDIGRLFRRFAPGSSGQSGTGLGLSIAREFMQAMGGSISYAPRGSGGANFVITFMAVELD